MFSMFNMLKVMFQQLNGGISTHVVQLINTTLIKRKIWLKYP